MVTYTDFRLGKTIWAPVFALAYFGFALLSLELTQNAVGIAYIWPSSGIAFAGLVLLTARGRVWLFAGLGLGSMAANLLYGVSPLTALGFTIANLVEAALAAWFVCNAKSGSLSLDRPSWMARFAIGAGVAALVSGSIATAFVLGSDPLGFFISWTSTVLLGILLIGPLILLAVLDLASPSRDGGLQSVSASSMGALIVVMSAISIGTFAQSTYPLLFVPFVGIALGAVMLGMKGAIASVVTVAVIGSFFTAKGAGPVTFVEGIEAQTRFFQFYLFALLTSSLPAASIVGGRKRIQAALREAHLTAENKAREAERASETDPLTGLPNRRKAMAFLDDAIAQAEATGTAFSILLLDVDHFKSVNDTYGHAMGDRVLQAIAESSHGCLRPTDLFARYGGEEFLAILPGAGRDMGVVVAERLRRSMEGHPIERELEGSVTVSIGVAIYQAGADATYLLQAADAALYDSKNSGRNRYTLAA